MLYVLGDTILSWSILSNIDTFFSYFLDSLTSFLERMFSTFLLLSCLSCSSIFEFDGEEQSKAWNCYLKVWTSKWPSDSITSFFFSGFYYFYFSYSSFLIWLGGDSIFFGILISILSILFPSSWLLFLLYRLCLRLIFSILAFKFSFYYSKDLYFIFCWSSIFRSY